jgi:hypothetical protein
MSNPQPWEPPEWVTPGTDLSFLPSWFCRCGQNNVGWARECGRCETVRPMDRMRAAGVSAPGEGDAG